MVCGDAPGAPGHGAAAGMPREGRGARGGREPGLGGHVLGPHVMTQELLPMLHNADGASVVFMSSGGMYTTPLSADDLESRNGKYNGVRVYARTKRMQVVLADQWAQRLAGTGIRVESTHPGWVETPGVAEALPAFRRLTGPLLRDAADGADTAVWLVATRPESKAGHFWHDRAQRPTTFGWQRRDDPAVVTKFLEEVSQMTSGV